MHERQEDETRYRTGVPSVKEWRAVCSCSWTGEWRGDLEPWGGPYADDRTGDDWDWHLISAPKVDA